ncbi:hypothetical protein GC096_25485 [Paenibacillus sp. LMG 31461]|uniref:Uncharacterized protein n=1 Tax=Paenibacillus plantarum TaxID=2654975 RepID=A0ABX1XFY2_9BACL|nr:hypothetical protein [Paenibacillus plantarum]NOU67402.1 hypothetical protein [Paenibacillus plantarum]
MDERETEIVAFLASIYWKKVKEVEIKLYNGNKIEIEFHDDGHHHCHHGRCCPTGGTGATGATGPAGYISANLIYIANFNSEIVFM